MSCEHCCPSLIKQKMSALIKVAFAISLQYHRSKNYFPTKGKKGLMGEMFRYVLKQKGFCTYHCSITSNVNVSQQFLNILKIGQRSVLFLLEKSRMYIHFSASTAIAKCTMTIQNIKISTTYAIIKIHNNICYLIFLKHFTKAFQQQLSQNRDTDN